MLHFMPRLFGANAVLAVTLLAAVGLDAQDKPPLPAPPGGRAEPAERPKVPELVPGKVPEGTPLAAQLLMAKLVTAMEPVASDAPSKPQRAPVTAFELSLDIQYKASDSQSNDMPDARYRWLAPNFVRADTGRGGAHLRGPEGAFFLDTKDPENVKATQLDTADRLLAEDRRQLEEISGLAANFAHLIDPRRVRLAKVSNIVEPVAVLPAMLHKRAAELAWLEIESPDFAVMRAGKVMAPTARVDLGVDPKTGYVEIAIVDDAAAPRRVTESTSVLQLRKYKPVEDFLVPHEIFVWMPEVIDAQVPMSNVALRPDAVMRIYVKAKPAPPTLRAKLTPQDFLPR
jgi:hypothetical protein